MVRDAFREFSFETLSSGAREQVLLALRVGFALRHLPAPDEALFLLLDDAFQYSDWKRREGLVRAVTDLAESGWQVFYFTMDDHIRDLFLKAGKRIGDDFVYETLDTAGGTAVISQQKLTL